MNKFFPKSPLTKPVNLFMMYKNENTSSGNPDFQSMTDEEICLLAEAGSTAAEEALVQRYGRMVRACARPLFLAGGERQDLFQEGMMGLLSAVRSRAGKGRILPHLRRDLHPQAAVQRHPGGPRQQTLPL